MGFFSDLKDDLSQAVNELNDQLNINEKETELEQAEMVELLDAEQAMTAEDPVAEHELSLDEMLDRIDAFGLPEEFLQEAFSIMGAERIMWGTDIPCTLKQFTYKQMLKRVADCGIFNEHELTLVFGENAKRVYHII